MSSLSKTNGVATFIMNYYEELCKNNYKIDFFLMKKNISNTQYLEAIKNQNGKIYYAPDSTKLNRYKIVYSYMKNEILKQSHYDIVHINLIDLYAMACIKSAKKQGIKKVIYHVHNPSYKTNMMYVRKLINHVCVHAATDLVACSKEAGKSMFGKKKFSILNNSVVIQKFEFDKTLRDTTRKELKINENTKLIGTVARITEQKNPLKIVNIVNYLLQKSKDIKFIWVGNGNMRQQVEEKVKELRMEDNFIFLGEKEDVARYYCAMDLFLLPSKFEGLGIVFLEAQASGLKVLTTDVVPKIIKKTDLVTFISNEVSIEEWGENVWRNLNEKEDIEKRKEYNKILQNSEFNVENKKNDLIKYYDVLTTKDMEEKNDNISHS